MGFLSKIKGAASGIAKGLASNLGKGTIKGFLTGGAQKLATGIAKKAVKRNPESTEKFLDAVPEIENRVYQAKAFAEKIPGKYKGPILKALSITESVIGKSSKEIRNIQGEGNSDIASGDPNALAQAEKGAPAATEGATEVAEAA